MVLVVDDDKVLTQLLRTLLETNGYEVEVAHDGEEAFSRLNNPKCKLILLDICMPGINGAELLMLMAAEEIDIPVVVIASFPDFDEEEMKNFPNVKAFHKKPFMPEDIISAVKRHAAA